MALTISQGFLDISFSFTRNPVTNDIFVFKNENAIKKSVTNLIKTKLGERFFNPLLGSSIENSIFELNDTIVSDSIEEEIENILENFEPRIKLDNVRVEVPEDSNDLNITVTYTIIGIPVPTQIVEFILQPTRV